MQVSRRAKQGLRSVTDRIARPYVDELRQEIRDTRSTAGTARPKDPAGVPDDAFHNLLHELRTLELERVPKGARTAISIGASGRWYFDWFERSVGPVEVHYGIEAFEPRPDDLPDYVEWVKATADDLSGVPDASGDILFAGQTTEHLWPHELAGFLAEAWRVLKPDGLLVLDSPNRLVTEHMMWSHGGHTIELSAGEITDLVELAGFEVESCHGIWLCRQDGSVVELEEGVADLATVARRIALADDAVDDSFIWWVNARRRSATRPPIEDLRVRLASLFDRHWPVRVCRGMDPGQTVSTVDFDRGDELRLSTLPFPLFGGAWTIGLRLAEGSIRDLGALKVSITLPGGEVMHELELSDGEERSPTEVVWTIDQPYLVFALTLAVASSEVTGRCAVELPLEVLPSSGWLGAG
jgi:hypothetical protein